MMQKIDSVNIPGFSRDITGESNRGVPGTIPSSSARGAFHDATLNEYPPAGTIIAVGTGAP